MEHHADDFRAWMDERGLSASDVAKDLRTEEQTIRKWRSQGVPDRRRPHIERYMAEWTGPTSAPRQDADTSVLRIEFTDEELDEVSRAAGIVQTPIREFVRRSAIHQARVSAQREETSPAPFISPASTPPPGTGKSAHA